ncbi:MAG: PilZ domain-containing protein [Desulfobulbaceae bacterium]|nr:PilZ domain-containing protein [Desulfobulbaceae bacterium]
MNSTDTSWQRCPHLSEGGHGCLMTRGGLYIPMPEHVDTLCKTSSFAQCYQYIQGCSAVRELTGPLGSIHTDSRRRYGRIKTKVPLQLVNFCQDERDATVVDQEAFAVDLSLGGIRLESRVPLSPQGKITFVAGASADASRWEGRGEVRWTKRLINGGFQSGLIVTDKKTFQAIAQHLGLSAVSSM